MAKQSFDQKMARLKQLVSEPKSDEIIREIKKALSDPNSVLSARAAHIAAKLKLCELGPDLVAAFHRYWVNPAKNDPGCRAKMAVIEALNAMEYSEPDVFLEGIRYVQLEYVMGQPTDTADQLRAVSAFGLYRIGYYDLLCEIVTLLADQEPVARRAAITVLKELGCESGEMLLRLKVLHGDKEADVMGDCFNALMSVAPMRSLQFVAQFLDTGDETIAEEAALAIGNSRLKDGFWLLQNFLDRSVDPSLKGTLFLAIALTRCDEAYVLLLDIVNKERAVYAAAAVQALAIYCDNPERREQIHAAVSLRNDPKICEAYKKSIEKL
jgi:HEAT repeat protein